VIDVLANDTDINDNTLSLVSAEANNGSVVINSDGTITYTPSSDFNGTDTISYEITDGGETATSTVLVTINPVNDAPVAINEFIHVDDGVTSIIDVLANDLDVDGDALSVTSASAMNGTVTINVDGTLSYTPNTGASGLDVINYEVTDGNGETSSASATINRLPSAIDDAAGTDENTAVTIDVLANDSDSDGSVLIVSSASASNGTVTINADGTLHYIPNDSFTGVDTISYDISDSSGGTSSATVNVTVIAEGSVNEDPVAQDDLFTVDAGTSGLIANLVTILDDYVVSDDRLLENDVDPEGTTLSITEVDGQALVNGSITVIGSNGGTFIVEADGTASFDASTDFVTLASGEAAVTEITYTVSDGLGGTDTATVQVTVNGLGTDAVQAQQDLLSVADGSGETALNVLANDLALVEGDVATVSAVAGDAFNIGNAVAGSDGGLFTIHADGSATFDTNGDFGVLVEGEVVTTSVSYTIVGYGGETSTTTVEVEVLGANEDPIAQDDLFTVEAGSNEVIANLITIFDDYVVSDDRLLGNDVDPEGATLSITEVDGQALVDGSVTVTGSNGGTFTISSDGTASFDASTGFESIPAAQNITTEVTYTVTDGQGGFDSASVVVTVNGVNDNPEANTDIASTSESDAITIDVLSNDTDVDGDALSISSIDTTGLQGSVIDNGDGTITYNANGQFESLNDGETADEWFEYTVEDGSGGFDTAQVQLTILGVSAAAAASSSAPEEAGSSNDPAEEPPIDNDFSA